MVNEEAEDNMKKQGKKMAEKNIRNMESKEPKLEKKKKVEKKTKKDIC